MLRRCKNHILYALARLLLGLLRALPSRLALALGRGLGRLGFWLARPERERARRNLRAGLQGLDEPARSRLLGRMAAHLGEAVAECAQLPRLQADRPDLVSFEPGSRQVLETALAEGRGVLFITGHLGNWELMAAALAQVARRPAAGRGPVPAAVLYKPSYDPRFTRLLCAFRAASGIQGIDVSRPGHLAEAIGVLRRGGALGLLIDQPLRSGVQVPFLGQPAFTSRLAPVLARRTGAAVVVGCSRRSGTCQHRVRIERAHGLDGWRDLGAALRELTAPLERAILEMPEQWTWSLDRWRGASRREKSSPYCK